MQRKWLILWQKVQDTLFCKRRVHNSQNMDRAKNLYFDNFANHMTMRKNGEYEEYRRYAVPKEVEYNWSLELKELLIEQILGGENLLQVLQLSRISLPEDEVLDAFKYLSQSTKKRRYTKPLHSLPHFLKPTYIVK